MLKNGNSFLILENKTLHFFTRCHYFKHIFHMWLGTMRKDVIKHTGHLGNINITIFTTAG